MGILIEEIDSRFKEFAEFYGKYFREKVYYNGRGDIDSPIGEIKNYLRNYKLSIIINTFNSIMSKENESLKKVTSIDFVHNKYNKKIHTPVKSWTVFNGIDGKMNSFDINFNLDLETEEEVYKNKPLLKKSGVGYKLTHLKLTENLLLSKYSIPLSVKDKSSISNVILNEVNSEIKRVFRHNRLNKKGDGVNLQIGDLFKTFSIRDFEIKDKKCKFILSFKSIFKVT